MIAALVARAPLVETEVALEARLESTPPGALVLADAAGSSFKLGPAQRQQQICVVAADAKVEQAQGVLHIVEKDPGPCPARITGRTVRFEVVYRQSADVHWLSAGQVPQGLPQGLRLAAFRNEENQGWEFQFRANEQEAPGVEFELVLPRTPAYAKGCLASLEAGGQNTDIRRAVGLRPSGAPSGAPAAEEMLLASPGTNRVSLCLRAEAGARLYSGTLKLIPQGKFQINGQSLIEIPISVNLTGIDGR